MPNWCYTDMVFCSNNKAQLMLLNDALNKSTDGTLPFLKNGFGCRWLGNIANNFLPEHVTYNADGEFENSDLELRGEIIDIDEEISKSDDCDGKYYFFCRTETAWAPKLKVFYSLLDKCFPEVSLNFKAEEPGMGIFVICNSSGFDEFDFECHVDISVDCGEDCLSEQTSPGFIGEKKIPPEDMFGYTEILDCSRDDAYSFAEKFLVEPAELDLCLSEFKVSKLTDIELAKLADYITDRFYNVIFFCENYDFIDEDTARMEFN